MTKTPHEKLLADSGLFTQVEPDWPQSIVFEFNGERYEAPVDPMPVKRSFLQTAGHLIVEHSSCSYAIYLDLRPDSERRGEYVAHRIIEGDEPLTRER